MPYIKPERRMLLDPNGGMNDQSPATVSGELNYQITMLIKQYWDNHGPNYQCINDILGALSGSKDEFYRRIAIPYEDIKIKENGDVWT
jgi:hypothetical protein